MKKRLLKKRYKEAQAEIRDLRFRERNPRVDVRVLVQDQCGNMVCNSVWVDSYFSESGLKASVSSAVYDALLKYDSDSRLLRKRNEELTKCLDMALSGQLPPVEIPCPDLLTRRNDK